MSNHVENCRFSSVDLVDQDFYTVSETFIFFDCFIYFVDSIENRCMILFTEKRSNFGIIDTGDLSAEIHGDLSGHYDSNLQRKK